jgi:pyruvate dehydrogenase E1 component alpha subunit
MSKAKLVTNESNPTKASGQGIVPEILIQMYQKMSYYRRFEERVGQAYTKQKFSGFCHLHIGQEAVAVGTEMAMKPQDYMIAPYRTHTLAIAKGIPGEQVMAELFGKVGGCCRGKGGSMHMFSKEHKFLGGHGIVGATAPIATGVGFAIRYRKEEAVCICFLGDAATNQGQFFEAMNMAATWALPVLFVIENNQYGMGTDIRRTTSVDHLYKRALAFDMEHSQVDGMDVVKVFQQLDKICTDLRQKPRPHLCEINTYRYRGHSVSDPGNYRTKEEVKKYQDIDPIETHGVRLKNLGIASDEQLKNWDQEAKAKSRAAEDFADASPPPDVSEAWQHVLVDW